MGFLSMQILQSLWSGHAYGLARDLERVPFREKKERSFSKDGLSSLYSSRQFFLAATQGQRQNLFQVIYGREKFFNLRRKSSWDNQQ